MAPRMAGEQSGFMKRIPLLLLAVLAGVAGRWQGWSAAQAGEVRASSDRSTIGATNHLVAGTTNDPVAERLLSARVSLEPVAPTEGLFTRQYGRLLLEDVREVFTGPARWRRREWLGVAVAGGAIAGITFADKRLQRAFSGDPRGTGTKVADEIAPFGAYYSFGVLGGFYFGGLAFHNDKARAVAQDGLAASLITSGMVVPLGKVIFGRPRPESRDEPGEFEFFSFKKDSFPSGHTAQAFTVASVISAHYQDQPWVSIVSYGAAAAVGWARVQQGRHFASEVAAGAVIGTFVGRTVVRSNRREREKVGAGPERVRLLPFHDGATSGLAVSWDF